MDKTRKRITTGKARGRGWISAAARSLALMQPLKIAALSLGEPLCGLEIQSTHYYRLLLLVRAAPGILLIYDQMPTDISIAVQSYLGRKKRRWSWAGCLTGLCRWHHRHSRLGHIIGVSSKHPSRQCQCNFQSRGFRRRTSNHAGFRDPVQSLNGLQRPCCKHSSTFRVWSGFLGGPAQS